MRQEQAGALDEEGYLEEKPALNTSQLTNLFAGEPPAGHVVGAIAAQDDVDISN